MNKLADALEKNLTRFAEAESRDQVRGTEGVSRRERLKDVFFFFFQKKKTTWNIFSSFCFFFFFLLSFFFFFLLFFFFSQFFAYLPILPLSLGKTCLVSYQNRYPSLHLQHQVLYTLLPLNNYLSLLLTSFPLSPYSFPRFFASSILHHTSQSSLLHHPVKCVNYVISKPVGVACLISPWNLPLYLLTWKIAPCIAMG